MRRSINIPIQDFYSYGSQHIVTTGNSLVIVGANGAGKTRFGTFIDENNRDVHRISAQKSLTMPEDTNTRSIDAAKREFLYGANDMNNGEEWLRTTGKKAYRYGNRPSTHLLSDYQSMMTLLFSEEFDTLSKVKDAYKAGLAYPEIETNLDIIIRIWESLLPHRKIQRQSGKIVVSPKYTPIDDPNFFLSNPYNGSDMSDGERVIFYLIGAAICTDHDFILILDEPELHLHKSIIKKLFDEIEKARPDILFVYLTHDIDFAVSRIDAKKIWLKGYNGQKWRYEFIPDQNVISETIYLEILGSRKNILFIEGTKESLDYQLYGYLFKDETLSPAGGCSEVIEATKSFNDSNNFHRLSARGIIDRDRRTDHEIDTAQRNGISVLKLAEIENLFLLEEVVKSIARRLGYDENTVFNHVKSKVIEIFSQEIEKHTTEYTVHFFKREITNSVGPANNWDTLKDGLESVFHIDRYQQMYSEFRTQFQKYIEDLDYLSILKYMNAKRVIVRSDLAIKCGLHNSEDTIRNQVYHTIKSDPVEGPNIVRAMIAMIS